MKKLTENLWIMAALTAVPVVGSFVGYRYWMRRRSKSYWMQIPAPDLYFILTNSPAPPDRVFGAEEHEEMASLLAAQDTPFWRLNFVSQAGHPSQQTEAPPVEVLALPDEGE